MALPLATDVCSRSSYQPQFTSVPYEFLVEAREPYRRYPKLEAAYGANDIEQELHNIAEAGESFFTSIWERMVSMEDPWDRGTGGDKGFDQVTPAEIPEGAIETPSLEAQWESYAMVRKALRAIPELSPCGQSKSSGDFGSNVSTAAPSGEQSFTTTGCSTPSMSCEDSVPTRRVSFKASGRALCMFPDSLGGRDHLVPSRTRSSHSVAGCEEEHERQAPPRHVFAPGGKRQEGEAETCSMM